MIAPRACLLAMTMLLVSASALAAERLIVLQDRQPWFQGSYGAYASPWSIFFDKSLIHGKHYRDTITIRPSRFPADTVIDTAWPVTKPEKSGVWGYHALSFGNYDGGIPPKPVRPRRVKDIRVLTEQFAFRYEGSPNFNLLNEFYLTSKPGDAAAKVIEIGFFLHAPATSLAFIRGGTFIGDLRDSVEREWRITRTKTFVTIVRADGADLPRGRLDIRGVLSLLVEKGVITGNEWFNGIAFGTEPTAGAGRTRLHIQHWQVDYR